MILILPQLFSTPAAASWRCNIHSPCASQAPRRSAPGLQPGLRLRLHRQLQKRVRGVVAAQFGGPPSAGSSSTPPSLLAFRVTGARSTIMPLSCPVPVGSSEALKLLNQTWRPLNSCEIMPCLVEAAEAVNRARLREGLGPSDCRHAADQAPSRLTFSCGDMLDAPLAGVTVVALTSQCWDRQLQRRCADKLCRELHPGALVLDYGTAVLGGLPQFGGEPLWDCILPVSWNPSQRFCVFRHCGATDGAAANLRIS